MAALWERQFAHAAPGPNAPTVAVMSGKRDAAGVALLAEIRACRACAEAFSATASAHGPRPVVQVDPIAPAPVAVVGQAPGVRVHRSGKPFDDPSGDRLRRWLGVDRDAFYDASRFSILPMGFCFPGLDAKGGDLPPPKRCAELWRQRLFDTIGAPHLLIVIGRPAIAWHAPRLARRPLTEAVGLWTAAAVDARPACDAVLVGPHPSWRNNSWLKKNPRFEAEVAPALRALVADLLAGHGPPPPEPPAEPAEI